MLVRRALLFRFLQENHIGIRVPAQYAELLSVRRPVEGQNLLRLKIRNPMSYSTVKRLDPDIVRTVLSDGIGYMIPVRGELHTVHTAVARNVRRIKQS